MPSLQEDPDAADAPAQNLGIRKLDLDTGWAVFSGGPILYEFEASVLVTQHNLLCLFKI